MNIKYITSENMPMNMKMFLEDALITVCYNSEIKVKRKISLMCGSIWQNNQIVQTIKIYIDSIVVSFYLVYNS